MRRRAFFGGEREPVYLFKEGIGFITNPLPGLSVWHQSGSEFHNVTFSSSAITFRPYTDEGSRYASRESISKNTGTVILPSLQKIDFDNDFKGYKKLFIELSANFSSGGSHPFTVGISTGTMPTDDAEYWITRATSYSSSAGRRIYEFDIESKGYQGHISFYGARQSGDVMYVHNIWLE